MTHTEIAARAYAENAALMPGDPTWEEQAPAMRAKWIATVGNVAAGSEPTNGNMQRMADMLAGELAQP